MTHNSPINWYDCDFGTEENPQCGICGATGLSLTCGRWDDGEQVEDTLCSSCEEDYEFDSDSFEYQSKIKIETEKNENKIESTETSTITAPEMTTPQMTHQQRNPKEEQKEKLMNEIKEIRSFMNGKSFTYEIQMAFDSKINKLMNEFWALERPDLCGRTCSVCSEKYNGWGNNPAPIKADDQCCDDCNSKFVIPLRMGLITKKQVKTAMKK
jgi:hypothetical protein